MRECSKCEKLKDKTEFYPDEMGAEGLRASCKECESIRGAEYKKKVYTKNSQSTPQVKEKKCNSCLEVKSSEMFHKDGYTKDGLLNRCKPCQSEYKKRRREARGIEALEVRRASDKRNAERLRRQEREYRKINRERINLNASKYRASVRGLPSTLTLEETEELINHFSSKCTICDAPYEHLDHFIPVSTGYGGTTKENMVPMCARCNTSKNGRNPFEWAKTLTQKDRERFDSLVEYLSVINGIATVEDYEAHVNQCFN